MRKAATGLIWANLFGAAFLPLMAQLAWIGPGVIGVGIVVIYLIARQWGALLPYLSQFGIAADSRAGMQTAMLYFANIVGCATGAVLTGFVLANWLGLKSMAVFLLAGGPCVPCCWSQPSTRPRGNACAAAPLPSPS